MRYMNTEHIVCPRCGNPRCSIQHDAMPKGWWVWCIAPMCNVNGPRGMTIDEAVDRFYDKMNKEKVSIDKCPICGKEAYIRIGWRNGHSDFVFSHSVPNDDCPANRVIHFSTEMEAKKWLASMESGSRGSN